MQSSGPGGPGPILRVVDGTSGKLQLGLATRLVAHVRRRPAAYAVLAAILLGGGALYVRGYNERRRSRATENGRDGEGGSADGPSAPAKRGRSGRGSKSGGPRALQALTRRLLASSLPRLAAYLAMAVGRTYLSNRLSRLQGYLFRAAFLQLVPLFLRYLLENIGLCLVQSALESTMGAARTWMELDWRRQLTRSLHRGYFDRMTYYRMSYVDKRIDTPEQRICEDVPKLAAGLAEVVGEWTSGVVDTLFYAYRLRQYTRTHKYTLAILAYILGAGVVTTGLSPPFGRLYKKLQSLEGTYRALHSRLRANAESVALYGGMGKESRTVSRGFDAATSQVAAVQRTQWRFGMVQDFFLKYLGATAAVILVIGPFFSGHLRPEATARGRAEMLSNMRYHTGVIITLFQSMGTLAASPRKLMKLSAHADRVHEMERVIRELGSAGQSHVSLPGSGTPETPESGATEAERMRALMQAPTGVVESSQDEISFDRAMVLTPSGNPLVRDLTLSVPRGTHLLVTGPNGAGKSSLFRVLGGLWPLTQGVVRKPGAGGDGGLAADIFYVPQRPYVSIGTLEEQLVYPARAGDARVDESDVRALLAQVDLSPLLDRGDWRRDVVDWGEALSLGEQQRLGMARLFFHKPRFAILDECTSGVTNDMEERFAKTVKEMGCTCVTISHRPALMAFHDIVLHLDGEGGWSLHDARSGGVVGGGGGAGGEGVSKGESGGGKGGDNERAKHALEVLQGMARGGKGSGEGAGAGAGAGGVVGGEVIARAPADKEGSEKDAELAKRAREAGMGVVGAGLTTWGAVGRFLELVGGGGAGEWRRLALIGVVVVLRTALQDRIANLNGMTVHYVLRQDLPRFRRLMGVSVFQSMLSAIMAQSLKYLSDSLALSWRRRITADLAQRYFSGNNLYLASNIAGMRDADQRIVRDVERLCNDAASLIPTMVKPVVDIVWFSSRMWMLTGTRGLSLAYLYMLLGLGALKAVTPDFGLMAAKEAALEGVFRNMHARLRTNAESVAFFGGGPREGSAIEDHFSRYMRHLSQTATTRWAHGVADEFFTRQLPHNVTWLLTLLYALAYEGDRGSSRVQAEMVHNMRYLASIVTNTFIAFGEVLSLHKRLVEMSGGVARVAQLRDALRSAARASTAMKRSATALTISAPTATAGPSVGLSDVTVVTPTGNVLARKLTLAVRQGEGALITGPNGSGKTGIVRVLAGLWPLVSGHLVKPETHRGLHRELFFVPQKPYTTPGTLREQLVYPLTADEAADWVAPNQDRRTARAALDARLGELMGDVRLRHLAERYSWDEEVEWGETLSLGEQQRLGMARLFFHKPRFAILDECTNATSVDVEEHLYQLATDRGITLVTITQRTALVRFHETELRLTDGAGGWELRKLH